MTSVKLLPRNMTAARVRDSVVGNPVSTRLEAGVGNCYPGLEFDIRNLDRRFFPHLTFDVLGVRLILTAVDLASVDAAGIIGADRQKYVDLRDDLARLLGSWVYFVTRLQGDFLGFGVLDLDLVGSPLTAADSGTQPSDPWVAVRLLKPDSSVNLELGLRHLIPADGVAAPSVASPVAFSGVRARYLDADGALAEMFAPGELTQSLCSPWTHDFRDCNCGYWSSSRPDIALPALPNGVAGDDPRWSHWLPWDRADRDTASPPPVAIDVPRMMRPQNTDGTLEAPIAIPTIAYFDINNRWQDLDIVLDGREVRGPYSVAVPPEAPLNAADLELHLRYAAGIELGAMLEYLSALFSLDRAVSGSELLRDVTAARAELLRVAVGEMKHLREVNGVLRAIHLASGDPAPFVPALGVASLLPGGRRPNGTVIPPRPLRFRRLTPDVMQEFVDIEEPSLTVDGVYTRIMDTFEAQGREEHAAVIGSLRADGAEHYHTFRLVQEWLTRHTDPEDYLLTLSDPDPANALHVELQRRYVNVLESLTRAYQLGPVNGNADLQTARIAMLRAPVAPPPGGIHDACQDLADAGLLVKFDVPSDPRFAAVAPVALR